MDNLISRQAAIDLVRDVCDAILSGCGSHYDGEDEVYDDLLEVDAILKCNKEIRIALANMPPAHPEGIRCKDCKHYKTEFCAIDIWTDEVKIYKARPDDFCSRAARREEQS